MKLCFVGITGYSNPLPNDIRNVLVRFFGNNAISGEDNLRSFNNMMDDFQVESEDVMMKLFMKLLIDDAIDQYRGFPVENIRSWEEFKRVLREQYGDKTNPRFMLNEFNNISTGSNEMVYDFNTKFQKEVYMLPLGFRPNDQVCLVTYCNASLTQR